MAITLELSSHKLELFGAACVGVPAAFLPELDRCILMQSQTLRESSLLYNGELWNALCLHAAEDSWGLICCCCCSLLANKNPHPPPFGARGALWPPPLESPWCSLAPQGLNGGGSSCCYAAAAPPCIDQAFTIEKDCCCLCGGSSCFLTRVTYLSIYLI